MINADDKEGRATGPAEASALAEEPCSHPATAWTSAGASHSPSGLAGNITPVFYRWCLLCGALGTATRKQDGKIET